MQPVAIIGDFSASPNRDRPPHIIYIRNHKKGDIDHKLRRQQFGEMQYRAKNQSKYGVPIFHDCNRPSRSKVVSKGMVHNVPLKELYIG